MIRRFNYSVQLPTHTKPLVVFAVCSVLAFALGYANDHGYVTLPAVVQSVLRAVIIIFTTLFVAALILKLTHRIVTGALTAEQEIEQRLIVNKLYSALIYFATAFIIMWSLGFTAQNLTLLLGFLATGIAFAVREILIAYLVWFMLLTKRPFRIGDYIKIGDDEGRVQHIGTAYVLLDETPETREEYIRVPNKAFLDRNIHNLGREKILLTLRIPLGEVPSDLDKRLAQFEKDMRGINPHILVLETIQDKVYVRMDCYTALDQRRATKNKILRSGLQIFRSKK